jgi:hypothetical protein
MEKHLHLYELQIVANKITKAMHEDKDIKWEDEFEQARQNAWDEFNIIFSNKE